MGTKEFPFFICRYVYTSIKEKNKPQNRYAEPYFVKPSQLLKEPYFNMPTINQLVRKPRKTALKKSKSPALGTTR